MMIIDRIKSNRFIRRLFGKSNFTMDNIKMDKVTVGDFSYGIPFINRWTKKYNLKIGKFCSIAENVQILMDGNHRPDWISMYPYGEIFKDVPKNPGTPIGKGDMEIGNDVWIGKNAMILPGVNVGNGAVIAAGSVVTKNVLPYEIVGGNPASHIRFRFSEKQIADLQKIAWWNWDLDKIKKEASILQSADVDNFINKYLNRLK